MRRIKELDITMYEVYDLDGDVLNNAINNFCSRYSKETESDSIYDTETTEIIQIMYDEWTFFDEFGNEIPIHLNIADDGEYIYSIKLTEKLLYKITLEKIGDDYNEKN